MTFFSSRLGLGLLVALVAVLLLLANAHLIWVAVRSQPDCAAHVRSGDADRPSGSYAAAKPSC
ncbi:MAG: hypothetical protein ACXWU1_04030 [Allosphingosinicella sp.]